MTKTCARCSGHGDQAVAELAGPAPSNIVPASIRAGRTGASGEHAVVGEARTRGHFARARRPAVRWAGRRRPAPTVSRWSDACARLRCVVSAALSGSAAGAGTRPRSDASAGPMSGRDEFVPAGGPGVEAPGRKNSPQPRPRQSPPLAARVSGPMAAHVRSSQLMSAAGGPQPAVRGCGSWPVIPWPVIPWPAIPWPAIPWPVAVLSELLPDHQTP